MNIEAQAKEVYFKAMDLKAKGMNTVLAFTKAMKICGYTSGEIRAMAFMFYKIN